MSDFFQNGVITTFHRLGEVDVKRLEAELKEFSRRRPIALILPSLYREFASGALPNIMNILRKTNYFNQMVLCLDRADAEQFKEVKNYFAPYRKFCIIWNDGPRMKKLYQILEKNDLSPGKAGKGASGMDCTWVCLSRWKKQGLCCSRL